MGCFKSQWGHWIVHVLEEKVVVNAKEKLALKKKCDRTDYYETDSLKEMSGENQQEIESIERKLKDSEEEQSLVVKFFENKVNFINAGLRPA